MWRIMNKTILVNIHKVFLLLAVLSISPDSLSMKRVRTTDQAEGFLDTQNGSLAAGSVNTQVLDSIWFTLPRDVVWRILFLSLSSKTDGMLVCKDAFERFNFKNWREIVQKAPHLILPFPIDCKRIYYLLIRKNDTETVEKLLDADVQKRERLKSLVNNFLWLNTTNNFLVVEMENLIDKSLPDALRCWYGENLLVGKNLYGSFFDLIMNHDTDGMETYLKTNTVKFDRYEECYADSIADYASTRMLKILAPVLSQAVDFVVNGNLERIDSYILARIAKSPERMNDVQLLLEGGASPNFDYVHSSICPAIKRAHKHNDYTLLKLLARYGLNVNPDRINRDREIWSAASAVSALIWAIQKKNPRLVNTLIILGADPLREEDTLKIAQNTGNPEIIDTIECAIIRRKLEKHS